MKKMITTVFAVLLATTSMAFAQSAQTQAVPVVPGAILPQGEGTPCPCNTSSASINEVLEIKAQAYAEQLLPAQGTTPQQQAPAGGADSTKPKGP